MYVLINRRVPPVFRELEIFLLAISGKPTVELLTRVLAVLKRYNVNYYELDLLELLNTIENRDHSETLDLIVIVVTDCLKDTLEELGVELQSTADLTGATEILESLEVITNFADITPLLGILELESTETSRFCNLLGYVSTKENFYFETLVESVDSEVLESITSILNSKIESTELTRDLSVYRERYNKLCNFVKPTISFRLLQEGLGFGSPFEYLVSLVDPDLDLVDNQPEVLSVELLGLILMSDCECDPIQRLKDLVLDYLRDANYLAATLQYIDNKLTGVLND